MRERISRKGKEMSQIKRITVTEANREFTKLLKTVDDNDIVVLTKQGYDKYAVISSAAFEEVKEDIVNDFVLDDEYIKKIKKYGTFRDKKDRICKLWLENNRVKIAKIYEEDGHIFAFRIMEVLPERVEIKKYKEDVMVHISSVKGDVISIRAYDADEISDDDYEAYALLGMMKRIVSEIKKPEKLLEGGFSGVRSIEY